MNAEQFAYWLRGFTELNPVAQPTPDQWSAIQQHLETVFQKVTPPLGAGPITSALSSLTEHQALRC